MTPRTVAHQAPLSVGFPRKEYWNELPFPSPEPFPNPGIEPVSPGLEVVSGIIGRFLRWATPGGDVVFHFKNEETRGQSGIWFQVIYAYHNYACLLVEHFLPIKFLIKCPTTGDESHVLCRRKVAFISFFCPHITGGYGTVLLLGWVILNGVVSSERGIRVQLFVTWKNPDPSGDGWSLYTLLEVLL